MILRPVSYTHLDVYKRQPLDGVTGTATMFVLKQYKNNGVIFDDDDKEPVERLLVTP